MLITRFRVKGFYGLNVNMDLGPLTVITGPPGSGKSLIIELLRRFMENFKVSVFFGDIVKSENGVLELTLSLNEPIKQKLEGMGYKADYLVVTLEVYDTGHVYVIKLDNNEILVVEDRQGHSRVKHPLNVEVKDASIIMDTAGLTPLSNAVGLVESGSSDYENILSLINELRSYVTSISMYKLGPYIDFKGYSKGIVTDTDYVGEHGEYTLELLSSIFVDPRRDGDVRFLRKVLGELGFRNFRVGWYGGKIVASYMDRKGMVHVGNEPPCHIKSLLAITTQIIMSKRPSLILIDNSDYCLSEELASVITKLMGNYVTNDRQIILEVKNKWFIDSLKMPHIVVQNLT